tara:strand:- start:32 stop:493 length:462 start_codon:yes stop_codon:yes gene_type:complete
MHGCGYSSHWSHTVIPTVIADPYSGIRARVSDFGQLAVAPLAYSKPSFKKLTVINTAYSFVAPEEGHQIVITDIILTANKNVGVNDATVDIYEAESPTTTVITQAIIELEMIKQSNLSLTGLNLIIPEGLWVNAKTDDNDIFVTLMYYRVPVE